MVNATEAHLLVLLVNTASKEAFEKNGTPIVFKSNKHLAFEVHGSESR
ncbi:helix-turn-helix domain-containing protein [Rhizobium sp. AN88]